MSTTMRFNITLPLELGLKLKTSKNWSGYVAESLRDKFAAEEQKKLNDALAEGYKARAKDDTALNNEYDHTIADGI